MTAIHSIYKVLHLIGIRKILFIFFIIISIFQFFKGKKNKQINLNLSDEELEETYSKNEEGLFPWEANTDDSPKSIPKDAKRHIYKKAGPKRGRW
ncbi:hypothetical protein ACQKTA_13575 (plasmid) [Enterococcus sp. 22-H-5-01]|uniref:hypothetical protein n=1 Tax=Enterococcus sp. 22-H-5-01 TaxID=3418555 RepID=UPI003CFE4BC0